MAAVSLKRIDIRRMVRGLLRSDSFPKEDIDNAINRAIEQINIMGRFRFHKTFTNLTMVTDDYDYSVPTTMLAEELLVFDPPVSPKPSTKPSFNIVKKAPSLQDALNQGRFVGSGDKPLVYVRFGDEFWFDPIPNTTANGKDVRVYHDADLIPLTHDMDVIPTRFNQRYTRSIIVMGAALEIEPNLEVNSTTGVTRANNLYQRAVRNMKEQELWEPLTAPNLIRDGRWTSAHTWGSVGSVLAS